jgi:hypothetical protein
MLMLFKMKLFEPQGSLRLQSGYNHPTVLYFCAVEPLSRRK